MKLPDGLLVLRDPHHEGAESFCYHNKQFYRRQGSRGKWQPIKKMHPTPKRVQMLMALLDASIE